MQYANYGENWFIAVINNFQKICIALSNLTHIVSLLQFLDITSQGFEIGKPGDRIGILCPGQLVRVSLFPALGNMYCTWQHLARKASL